MLVAVLVHTRVAVKAVITTKMHRGGNRGFSKTGVNCSTATGIVQEAF